MKRPILQTVSAPEAIVAVFSLTAFAFHSLRYALFKGWPNIGTDQAFFQHAGWYVTQGAKIYIDIWDPKPPAVIETTTLLAFISNGNILVLHILSIVVTALATALSAVFVTRIVAGITDNERGAILAGLVFNSFPFIIMNPFLGFGMKTLTVMFGLVSIASAMSDRPYISGAAAVISTAYWQFAVIFAVIPLLILSRKDYGRYLAGGVVLSGLILMPIVYWGAFTPMLVEAVVAPVTSGETQSFLYRLVKGTLAIGWSLPLCLLGIVGLALQISNRGKGRLWTLLLFLWFSLQIFVFDYDGTDDLIIGFVLVSIGIGLLYEYEFSFNIKWYLEGLIIAMVIVNAVTLGGAGVVTHPIDYTGSDAESPLLPRSIVWAANQAGYDSYQIGGIPVYESHVVDSPYGTKEIPRMYWDKIRPTSCHYRLSDLELRWISKTSDTINQTQCGDVPEGIAL